MSAQKHTPEEELETKPFLAHLEDLRWTLVRCLVAFILGVIGAALMARTIFYLLLIPVYWAGEDPRDFLVVINVTDPFTMHMDIAIMGGFLFSLPFILFYVGDFLLPALTKHERGFLLPIFTAATLLFVGGVAFAYFFVLRATLVFFVAYSKWEGIKPTWTAKNLIDFEIQLLIGFGVAAELPLCILILNILGLVSSAQLSALRRHAAFSSFVLACCIVPTTDLITLSLMAVPMYLLYELCIWIAYFIEARNRKKDKIVPSIEEH